jgi:adenine-specific DNA methylase
MIFNCLNCGVSISSRKENCPHCRISNHEAREHLSGKSKKPDYLAWKQRVKGSILTLVTR